MKIRFSSSRSKKKMLPSERMTNNQYHLMVTSMLSPSTPSIKLGRSKKMSSMKEVLLTNHLLKPRKLLKAASQKPMKKMKNWAAGERSRSCWPKQGISSISCSLSQVLLFRFPSKSLLSLSADPLLRSKQNHLLISFLGSKLSQTWELTNSNQKLTSSSLHLTRMTACSLIKGSLRNSKRP